MQPVAAARSWSSGRPAAVSCGWLMLLAQSQLPGQSSRLTAQLKACTFLLTAVARSPAASKLGNSVAAGTSGTASPLLDLGCLISGAVGTIVCTSCLAEVGLAWLQEPQAASRLLVAQAEGPEAGARAYPQPPNCQTQPQPGGQQLLALLALLASPCLLPLLLPQLPPPAQLPPLLLSLLLLLSFLL